MSDDLVITSTSDTEAQMQAALVHGISPPDADLVLSSEDRETGAIVPEEVAEVAADVAVNDEPAAKDEPAKKDEPATKDEPAKEAVKKEEPALEAKAGEKKERPKREDFATEEEWEDAVLGFKAVKRIGKLTWQVNEEKRRADALQVELDALKSPVKTEEPAKTAEVVDTIAAELEALGKRPALVDFETTEAWEEKLAEYSEKRAAIVARGEAQKVIAAERAKVEDAAVKEDQATDMDTFMEERVAAAERYPDFEQVMAENADMELSGVMNYVIVKNPAIGHDITHYLATHREEADALFKMGNSPEAILAMGELKQKVTGLRPAEKAADQVVEQIADKPVIVTKTPDPINPVGGRSTTSSVPLDKMTQEEFKALRNRQDTARRLNRAAR